MRVDINANGRSVTIECGDANVTYEGVADKALEVWHKTSGRDSGGPAYGFQTQAVSERPPSTSSRRSPAVPR